MNLNIHKSILKKWKMDINFKIIYFNEYPKPYDVKVAYMTISYSSFILRIKPDIASKFQSLLDSLNFYF